MEYVYKLLILVGMGLGLKKYMTGNRSPLYPWDRLGSSAYVYVGNPSTDTIHVRVSALEVDSTIR